MMQLTV